MVQEIKKLFVLLTAILSLTTACAGMGTETGNPFSPTDTGNPNMSPCPAYRIDASVQAETVDDGEETDLDTLIEYVCLRIFICDNDIHTLDCIAALNGPEGDGLLDALGLAPGQQEFAGNEAALDDCRDDILDIECDEISLHVGSDDFTDVANIIPSSCEDVFGEAPDGDVDPSLDPCI